MARFSIIIYREYEGQERLIFNEVMKLMTIPTFKRRQMRIKVITKISPAHRLALSVLRKKKKPDKILTYKEIEEILRR